MAEPMLLDRSLRLDGDEVARLAADFEERAPEDLLRWAISTFRGRLALATSFQADGMAMLDMAWRIDPGIRVITVDSGRLPQETYDLIEQVRLRYGIAIEIFSPAAADLETFVGEHGPNPFYRSLELRVRCCDIRKVTPLSRALSGFDAWISGQRRDQTTTRRAIRTVEIDHAHGGLLKLNPLARWSEDQVWDYLRANDVPYHALYDRGYKSIGCAPCTRATRQGEDPRAGRWWWETNVPKECGIHCTIDWNSLRA
jgi:phosphoadenosine phosphosulfate reductase